MKLQLRILECQKSLSFSIDYHFFSRATGTVAQVTASHLQESETDPTNDSSGSHLICCSLQRIANQYIYQASYLSRSHAFIIEHISDAHFPFFITVILIAFLKFAEVHRTQYAM